MNIRHISRQAALLIVFAAAPAQAQYNGAQPAQGTFSGGTSVAYGQALYYTQRLGPSRVYPPSRYGWIETGRGQQQTWGARPVGR